MNHSYDYFLCYAGKDIKNSDWNVSFAKAICESMASVGKSVYFAEQTGKQDKYKDIEALTELITGMKAIVVLLSPHFYDDFNPDKTDNAIKMEMDIALKEAERRMAINPDPKAFFIKYIRLPGFEWNCPNKFCVEKCYGDKYEFSKFFQISSFIPTNDAKESAKEFCEFIGENVRRAELIKEYRKEVELCFHSIVTHYKTMENTPIVTNKKLKALGVDNYKYHYWPVFFADDATKDDKKGDKEGASTCAVSFAVLHILHWIDVDCNKVKEGQDKSFFEHTRSYFLDMCKNALGTLVAMRAGDKKDNGYWSEMKHVYKDSWQAIPDDSYDAGLNQTTLSISTLLKSEFLDAKSDYWNDADEETLENRYKFICDSVSWILSKRGEMNNAGALLRFWTADEQSAKGSAFLTAICLDTLIKFAENEYVKKRGGEILDRAIQAIKDIIYFFDYLQYENDPYGICMALNNRKDSFSHTAKIMNSLCMLRGSLYKFNIDSKEKTSLCNKVDDIIANCFIYLMSKLEDKNSSVYKSNDSYEYFILPMDMSNGNRVEYYELNGELLAVTAITKLLDGSEWSSQIMRRYFKKKHDDKFDENFDENMAIKTLLGQLIEFFNNYRANEEIKRVYRFFDITASESLLVRGRRSDEDKRYPIYALYYYRMALVELLKILEPKSDEEDAQAKFAQAESEQTEMENQSIQEAKQSA